MVDGGRSVAVTRKYIVIDHHLKHCMIVHYAIVVVEWSIFFENYIFAVLVVEIVITVKENKRKNSLSNLYPQQ